MNSMIQQGIHHFQHGDIDSAIPLLQGVIKNEPNNEEANYILGVCKFRKKQFAEAERFFSKVVSINNAHYNAQYYLGLALERQNRKKEEFISQYRIALALKPDFKEAKKKLETWNVVQPVREQSPAKPDLEKLRETGKLIYEGKRRIRSFSFLFVLMFISLSLFLFAWYIASTEDANEMAIFALYMIVTFLVIFVSIILQSYYTRYTFYQKRIDFTAGVLFRKKRSLWLFQVEDTWITRTPFNLITGDATVHVKATGLETVSGKSAARGGHFRITGLGNYKSIGKLWKEVRDAGLVERRAMKNWFV
ncbi:tetratricopeptide repeat protein [bacterium]|nr:tetratricopeptide repeat protein [bacterium]